MKLLAVVAQLNAAEEREDLVAAQAAQADLAARGCQVALGQVEADVDAQAERD